MGGTGGAAFAELQADQQSSQHQGLSREGEVEGTSR